MFRIIMKKIVFLMLIILNSLCLSAEESYTVVGKVIDSESKAVLPGATIQILKTNNGTYTNSYGRFRLPFLTGEQKLRISSIGYDSKEVSVNSNIKDTLFISLKPSSVMLKGVQVVGEIEPAEIIRRAIERKQENLSKIKTFTGKLYSKLSMEAGGSLIESASSDGRSVSFSASIGGKVNEEDKMFILETFSDVMQDLELKKSQFNITERRQTANMKPESNILAIGNFINFYDEEIEILNAKISTPLCKKALSYYNFKLKERTTFDDKFVYVLEFEPSTRLYPLFRGTIKIIEGTYNMIAIDLEPTKDAGITFFKSLHFSQKFSEIQKNIWHPTYLSVYGKVGVDIIKSFLDVSVDVYAVSIYNNTKVNIELPKSFYEEPFKSKREALAEENVQGDTVNIEKAKADTIVNVNRNFMITVSKMADSTNKEFWEKNSFAEVSEKEKRIYAKIDSIVATKDTNSIFGEQASSFIDYTWFSPFLEFNRTASINLGLSPKLRIWYFNFDNLAYYSFGQKKLYGSTELNFPSLKFSGINLKLSGKCFSLIEPMGDLMKSEMFLNTVSAAFLHIDNFDYFKKDGWSVNLSTKYFDLISINGRYEEARHFNLDKTTDNSIFSEAIWRDNPAIEEGNYKNLFVDLSIGNISPQIFNSKFMYEIKFSSIWGEYTPKKEKYNGVQGSIELSIPLIPTGYQDMKLELFAQAGKADNSFPLEYQYKLKNKPLFINPMGYFYTTPICHYGGNEFYVGQVNFNLTDIWWRALWLPLYEGRGPDLILKAISGKFENKTQKGIYNDTNGNFYSEIGFGLRRIPTFISNVFYLGLDCHWGVGPVASGLFGWNLTATLPF